MTRAELRVFLDGWFCGCGSPEAASEALLRLLRLHPAYDHGPEIEEALPDDGLRYLTLYTLERFELTEHGGSVDGGWLTETGTAVRDALSAEEADEFSALHGPACAHGIDLDADCDECNPATRAESDRG
jgi:hypothetical protein